MGTFVTLELLGGGKKSRLETAQALGPDHLEHRVEVGPCLKKGRQQGLTPRIVL